MYGSAADAKLDAMYDARERDPLPAETPPTDEEMEAMHEHFVPKVTVVSWEERSYLPYGAPPTEAQDWVEVEVELPDEARKHLLYHPHNDMITDLDGDSVAVALWRYPHALAEAVEGAIIARARA